MVFATDKKIFIKTGSTDMRKQINRLALLAQEAMPEPPLSGAYFVFCGKTHRSIKVLYWDNINQVSLRHLEGENYAILNRV